MRSVNFSGCRRQLLLWDKKTQLAKEMKELVHSDEGQSEVKALKTEIHQMEVRSKALTVCCMAVLFSI